MSGVTLDKSTSSNLTSVVVDNESKEFALKIIFSKLLVILIGSSLNPFVFDSYTKGFKLEPINMTNSLEKIIFNANSLDSLSTTTDVKFEDVDLSKVTPDIDSLKLGGIVHGKLEL